jgi:hypothetical protein
MTNTPNTCYFETLSSCVTQVGLELAERHAVPSSPDWSCVICDAGPINYGCHRSFDFELAELNMRPTRKYFHATIWRLESGRYELNCYVL